MRWSFLICLLKKLHSVQPTTNVAHNRLAFPYLNPPLNSGLNNQILPKIKISVKEIKLIKSGKKKARNAENFLNEL